MTGRATEAAAVVALSLGLTLVVAAPVLRAPSERIFGREIVGRHYDPFTVMEQFARPIEWTALLQPITDVPGAVLAKYIGAVASYNVVVLLSFPLTAIAAYLLARHCALSAGAAAGAALAVAFSPFHLAHAAYHPHVAQLQWMPLYLLALWRCLDRPSPGRQVLLACAIAGVTLSNFYGGLIAIAITPVAVGASWLCSTRRDTAAPRRLMITSAVLLVAAVAGASYIVYVAGDSWARPPLEFARGDSAKYGANGWSYVAAPAAHPWFARAGHADAGLLEQQLSLGWGLIALGMVAIAAWCRQRATVASLARVPVLAAVCVFALWCSFPPPPRVEELLPMFRSYARFGSVVQLMIALLAAIGAQWLWQSGALRARLTAVVLVVLAAAEYAVWPPALWRDVLPTAAHRWAAQQPAPIHVLDCFPHTQESQSVQWLTAGRVILRPGPVGDCREPGTIATLSAAGFTHMLVRRHTPEGEWFAGRAAPAGLRLAARFDTAQVFAVTEPPSLVRTIRTQAFYPVEFDNEWTWRWMGPQASWTVVNTSARSLLASVDLEANAFHESRQLTIVLDGAEVQDLRIEARRAIHRIGPLALRPGDHTLTFRATSPPTVADDRMHNGDPRALSVAFGDWRWSIEGAPR